MAEASGQQDQLFRKGRTLMSVDLAPDNGPNLAVEHHIANTAWPAQLPPTHIHPSSQRASNEAVPLHQADRRSSSLSSVTSDEIPLSSSGLTQGSSKVPPLPYAPRAIPAGQTTIPLGPIRQPLQGSLPRNPHYLPRSVPQAPLLQTQPLQSGWSANDLVQIQQQRYQQLTAAHAIGYCQVVKQQFSQGHRATSVTFSRHKNQSSKQPAAHAPAGSKAQHANTNVSMAANPPSGQKGSDPDNSLQQEHTKQRLVHIAEPQHSSAPAAQGLIRFQCSVADIVDAHWPNIAQDEQSNQLGPTLASTAHVAHPVSRDSSIQEQSQATDNNLALGRGSSRRLLSMSCCDDPAEPSALPQPPAASSDATAPRTSAFAALSIGSETVARKAVPLPHHPTAQSVDQAIAAAQSADCMFGSHEAAWQNPLTNALSHGYQDPSITRLQQRGSGQAQTAAASSTGFPLSSFPQVMTQLLSEPSLHAWVAAYQPPASSHAQQDVQASQQGCTRPQKRARQGEPSVFCFVLIGS